VRTAPRRPAALDKGRDLDRLEPAEARVQMLRRVGESLYGDRWQTALAGDLQVNERTMRYWVSGTWPIPPNVFAEARELVTARMKVLDARLRELTQLAKRETNGQSQHPKQSGNDDADQR
jgi:hypothetical protein